MDAPAKPQAKTLCGFNCLDRHLREVERHQNISNAQLFHASSMNSSVPAGSALLAKTVAFFAQLTSKL
jgi:hypothetical protein